MKTNRIQLEIPDDEQQTLFKLAQLPEAAIEALGRSINAAVPTLGQGDLIPQIEGEEALRGVTGLQDLVRSLVSVAGTSYSASVTNEEMADSIAAALTDGDVVETSEDDLKTLKRRLVTLSRLRTIEMIAKGAELSRANDRSVRSAKIITDLRPICRGEEAEVAGAVIIHQLAIHSFHNSRNETMYFSLDSEDLKTLADAVSRALLKDKALRQFAESANTVVLTPIGN
jgi:hypothetical protein